MFGTLCLVLRFDMVVVPDDELAVGRVRNCWSRLVWCISRKGLFYCLRWYVGRG